MDEPRPRPGIVGAIALIVIGLVILVPSGLCTGVMGGSALWEALVQPATDLFEGLALVAWVDVAIT